MERGSAHCVWLLILCSLFAFPLFLSCVVLRVSQGALKNLSIAAQIGAAYGTAIVWGGQHADKGTDEREGGRASGQARTAHHRSLGIVH